MKMPEPVGFRTRYRSEPGMIGNYPWTYADERRRSKIQRPEYEREDLYTEEQMKQALIDLLEEAEKEMLKKAGELGIFNHHATKQLVQVVRSLKETL
jgi:hypothetical protein